MIPSDFMQFSPREGQLADIIWRRRDLSYSVGPPIEAVKWMDRWLQQARVNINYLRNNHLTNQVLKTDFTEVEIANVEHFFCGAAIANYFGETFARFVSANWDLVISPLSKVARGTSVRDAWRFDSMQHRFDVAGITFGLRFGSPPSIGREALTVLTAGTSLVKSGFARMLQ